MPAAPEPAAPAAPEPMPPAVEPAPPEPAAPEPAAAEPMAPAPEPAPLEPAPPEPAAPEPAPPALPPTPPLDTDPFSSNGAPGVRMWTDISGKYHCEARFVGLMDGSFVRLQRPDGQYVRILLEKLSLADQQFVRQQFGGLATAW